METALLQRGASLCVRLAVEDDLHTVFLTVHDHLAAAERPALRGGGALTLFQFFYPDTETADLRIVIG